MTDLPSLPPVDIVICVHNALEHVKECYESAARTDYPSDKLRIILIDDGSDTPTQSYLEDVARQNPSQVTLIRREVAGGYTVAANTGLRASRGDFCLMLNSDTIVPGRWLHKMLAVFQDRPDVGIVGPLSNAASWQSVPDLSNPAGGWAINELPEGWSVDDMDGLVENSAKSVPVYPRVPLLNGFCFMIRKRVCDEIGYMDEEGFPRGFGEEDDFCMRAASAGFGIVVAIDTYVFHAKSKSYGSTKRNELSQKGQIMLKKKHSEARLKRAVETMKKNPYLTQMRTVITRSLTEAATH